MERVAQRMTVRWKEDPNVAIGELELGLSVDLSIAPSRLTTAIGSFSEPALLISGGDGSVSGSRYSVFTAEPIAILETRGRHWRTREPKSSLILEGVQHPLQALSGFLQSWGLDGSSTEPSSTFGPSFRGGAIGYIGYDLAPWLEQLPRKAPKVSDIPDIRLAIYDWAVIVDRLLETTELWVFPLSGETDRTLNRRLLDRRNRIEAALETHDSNLLNRGQIGPIRADFQPAEYQAAVAKALDYIRAGDIFQVNLSQRFAADLDPNVSTLGLFQRVQELGPAPFSAYLQWDDKAIVSASPEWFYQIQNREIVTRPIKGTRPRGQTPQEDLALMEELRTSVKDQAELAMIVDLERNDLGRICEYGSIKVTQSREIESFAQVHHLVATVEGRLRPDISTDEVVQAVFPGGSITGAPKIRAMQIIDELEPCQRGVYTGSIGYITRGGDSFFNIAIRTLVVENRQASFHVGGGIVADSDPILEYEETLHKGRALRSLLTEKRT